MLICRASSRQVPYWREHCMQCGQVADWQHVHGLGGLLEATALQYMHTSQRPANCCCWLMSHDMQACLSPVNG